MTMLDADTSDSEALRTFFSREAMATLRTFTPATVVALRNGGKAVDVLVDITQWQTLDDQDRELATASVGGVPVFTDGDTGTGLFLSVPIAEGTEGWLLVSDRALDKWQFGRGAEPPPNTYDLRHHDLTDSVFIPGGSRDTHDRPLLAGLLALANRDGTCYIAVDATRALIVVPGGATLTMDGSTIALVGETTIEGDLSVTGNFTMSTGTSGTGTINGNLAVAGNLTITGECHAGHFYGPIN